MTGLKQEDRELTQRIFSQFLDVLHKSDVSISKKQEQDVILATLKHMRSYVDEYNVTIQSIDIYKIISWAAFFLVKEINDEYVIVDAAHIMNKILYADTHNKYQHIDEFIIKITLMALNDSRLANDSSKDDLAIGMNGFYMAFKSPSMMYLRQDSAIKSLNFDGF